MSKVALDISKEAIAEIVAKMRDEGVQISWRKVRDRLGGGSYTKIGQLIRQVLIENPEVPASTPDEYVSVIQAADQLAKSRNAEQVHRLQEIIEDKENDLTAVQTELVEKTEENERLSRLVTEMHDKITHLYGELHQQRIQLEAAKKAIKEYAEAKGRSAAFEELRPMLKELSTKIGTLTTAMLPPLAEKSRPGAVASVPKPKNGAGS